MFRNNYTLQLYNTLHYSLTADEISTSKQYLTSKLVEDSIKWQHDKKMSQIRGNLGFGPDSKSPSPFSSPVHRGAVANTLHSPIKLKAPRPQKLNVSASNHGNTCSNYRIRTHILIKAKDSIFLITKTNL